ncbi:MAG TPA: cyclopropane-fatty-acyl-phospholipid synthase family protein [Candidatus Baltobacteraceae bacterium]|nr:cyclopropane-fatty-acyl-phospholipid synthase family protein [Candidatus Baltobacteraceae bacterium]
MIAEEFASGDPYARIAAAILRLVFGNAYGREFGVRLWDGSRIVPDNTPSFALVVNAPGALRAAFAPPLDLSLGRAFGAGLLDVEGSVEDFVDAMFRASDSLTPARVVRLIGALRRLPKPALPALHEASLHGRAHSAARDRAAVGFHYDQPVEFYASFLDPGLVYSCAYYDEDVSTLEAAQSAKLDHTLRKLRLRPGERLLDIGCGWGALVIKAARDFGVEAVGITLSRRQYEEATRRVAEASLGDRARIEQRDYRELRGERFDKIVSVGMFEHVGRARFAEYFRAAFDALRPGGLFLNHAIADQSPKRKGYKASGFLGRYIFPDGELVSVSEALRGGERAGFEVRDVENLREHYERTLRDWVSNLERNRAAAIAAAGAESYRLWRLYLAGSAQGFRSGRIAVYQSLLAKPDASGNVDLPRTRRDLYASS